MDNRQMSRFVDTFRLHSAISGILQPKPWGRLAYLVEYGVLKEHFVESMMSKYIHVYAPRYVRLLGCAPCVVCVVSVLYDSTIGMFG